MYEPTDVLAWMLIVMRVIGMFMLAPVFSQSGVPFTGKMAIAAAIGFAATPFVAIDPTMPATVLVLILAFTKEFIVGLCIGMAIRMIFFVLDFAAYLLTTEIGLQPSAEFDPSRSTEGNPLGSALYFFGLVMLLSGSEYDILRAFVYSYEVAPVGFDEVNVFAGDFIIETSAGVFKTGILIAAPIIAVNFLVNLVFAALGKVVPKLNVFILSFSARILLGLTVLALSIGLIARYTMDYIDETPEMMLRFIIFRPEI